MGYWQHGENLLPCFWEFDAVQTAEGLGEMTLRDRFGSVHGGWIALLGVVILSPDALLLRLIAADDFTTAFWRLGFLTVALLAALPLSALATNGRSLIRRYSVIAAWILAPLVLFRPGVNLIYGALY